MTHLTEAVRARLILLATAWIGLALGVIIVMSSTFSVLLGPITAELGWDRAQLSLAYSLFSLTSTLSLPAVGRLVDSLGPRRVIVACVCLFGLLTLSLRFVAQLWHLYALFVLLGLISGGTSTLPYFKILVESFSGRRGLALGIANSGAAVGMFVFPLLAFHLNAAFGWRNAYLVLGSIVAFATIAVVSFGLRSRYLTLAARPPEAKRATQLADPGIAGELSLRQAARTPAFHLIGVSFFMATTVLVGYLIHVVPLLTDRGMSAYSAAFAASIFGAGQIAGRLSAGYLLDRLPSHQVVAGLWLGAAASFLLLWSGITGGALFVCTFFIGIAFGGEGDVLAYQVGRHFGSAAFGRIYSVLLMINLLGAVAGPYLFGVVFRATGSYSAVLGGAAICLVIAASLAATVRGTRMR